MSVEDRIRQVRRLGYCKNCLARSHVTSDCTSADVCKKCGWEHHTLLHLIPNRISPEDTHQTGSRNSERRVRFRESRLQVRRFSGREHRTSVSRDSEYNRQTNIRKRGSNIRDRLGPYNRPAQTSQRNDDISDNEEGRPITNPKRILLGALRALERLASTL